MGLQGEKLIGNRHLAQMPVIDRAAQGRQGGGIAFYLFRCGWLLGGLARIVEKMEELPEEAEAGCGQQKKKKAAEPVFSAPLSGGWPIRRCLAVFALPAPHQ
jgi:hypothetical protein